MTTPPIIPENNIDSSTLILLPKSISTNRRECPAWWIVLAKGLMARMAIEMLTSIRILFSDWYRYGSNVNLDDCLVILNRQIHSIGPDFLRLPRDCHRFDNSLFHLRNHFCLNLPDEHETMGLFCQMLISMESYFHLKMKKHLRHLRHHHRYLVSLKYSSSNENIWTDVYYWCVLLSYAASSATGAATVELERTYSFEAMTDSN